MNFIKNNAVAVIALVIAIIALFPHSASTFGAIKDTSYFDYFNAATGGAFQVNGTNVLSATSLALTTSNTATSTATLGCIQTYATSTATAVRFELSTTTSLATYGGTNGASAYGVSWTYGTCPH